MKRRTKKEIIKLIVEVMSRYAITWQDFIDEYIRIKSKEAI